MSRFGLFGSVVRRLHYDYTICGGGSVGLALANGISNSKRLRHKRVLLVEKGRGVDSNRKTPFPETPNRVYLTNPASVNLFKSIGIWEELERSGAHKTDRVEIWDEYVGLLELNPIQNKHAICYMVDNAVLQRLLMANLDQFFSSGNLEHKTHTTINNYNNVNIDGKPVVGIELSDGSVVTSDLLIGCDGANSNIRKLAGIDTWEYDYDVVDHVCTVKHSPSVDSRTAFKKFSPNGYVAFLPGVSSLSFCVCGEHGKQLTNASDEEFLDALNRFMAQKTTMPSALSFVQSCVDQLSTAFKPGIHARNINRFSRRPLVIDSVVEGSRLAFPLRAINSNSYVKDRVILMGDAAHRVNPICGQGLNLGLKAVTALVNTLENVHLIGYENYNPPLLEEFNSERRRDIRLHIAFGTTLHHIFTNDFKPLTFARSYGLHLANQFPYKDFMIDKVTH